MSSAARLNLVGAKRLDPVGDYIHAAAAFRIRPNCPVVDSADPVKQTEANRHSPQQAFLFLCFRAGCESVKTSKSAKVCAGATKLTVEVDCSLERQPDQREQD